MSVENLGINYGKLYFYYIRLIQKPISQPLENKVNVLIYEINMPS